MERRRLAVALGAGAVLVALIVSYGLAMDRGSLSLAECVAEPAICEGRELHIGYARVLQVTGRTVALQSWMGPVEATPWPEGTPLPSPGLSVSLLASHRVGASVTPHLVQEHPHRRLKERTGMVMLALWAVVVGRWVRDRWVERGGDA